VYVDSPLAVNATEVFKMHPECYDTEARAFHRVTGDILGNGCCTYVRDVEESKALHRRRRPCVIISASGMCEAGRIRHHLKNNIRSRKNTILLPGFMAEHTLGRKLAEGAERIRLFHETFPVRAEVVQIHGFSGHADQAELLQLLTPLKNKAKNVFVVHGEGDQSTALAGELRAAGFAHVETARRGQRVAL
jgi:metallo-beta-lactamase family protein